MAVARLGEGYSVAMQARLDAPAHRAWTALTDLRQLGALSPAFRAVHSLPSLAPGTERLRTLTRVCVLIFCRDIVQVQDFIRPTRGWLHAQVDPAASDLREGEADWHLVPDGRGTRLLFHSRFVPDFWVPPVIGPWAVRRALAQEAWTVTDNLERLAREVRP